MRSTHTFINYIHLGLLLTCWLYYCLPDCWFWDWFNVFILALDQGYRNLLKRFLWTFISSLEQTLPKTVLLAVGSLGLKIVLEIRQGPSYKKIKICYLEAQAQPWYLLLAGSALALWARTMQQSSRQFRDCTDEARRINHKNYDWQVHLIA